jgi:hypothetical protein
MARLSTAILRLDAENATANILGETTAARSGAIANRWKNGYNGHADGKYRRSD